MKRAFASVGIRQAEITPAIRARFVAKIEFGPFDVCWPWIGGRTPQGYGHFRLGGSTTTAQRVAYAVYRGDVEPGLTIDHLCGNPSCVNPAHLDAVTHLENLRRGRKSICAINARKTKCPEGHAYATYFHKSNGRTQRYCPTCKRNKGREWMRRHRAAKREAATV